MSCEDINLAGIALDEKGCRTEAEQGGNGLTLDQCAGTVAIGLLLVAVMCVARVCVCVCVRVCVCVNFLILNFLMLCLGFDPVCESETRGSPCVIAAAAHRCG